MKQRSIMKKSAFMTRRKIIIYIILTILILGIVAGFTDPFITDNTKYTAGKDEIIVMEAMPPESGSPEDYDLISNLKFAAYKLHHASFFRGETNGKVIADLGITTYTQNIHNTRYATDEGIVFAETISSSSMKSVAEQKYADNGIIIYRPSTSVNGSNASFSDKAYAMTYEDYSKNYGSVPNQLSKYIINEKSIKSVKDENAQTKKAANSPNGAAQAHDEAGFDFYVPETLVAGEDGNYKFSLTLDATESTLYYRNEVRTLGGADQNPKFYSVSVTVTIDKNWNPISVYSVENYDIAIPVLGAMNCTGRLTEVFTQIGDPDAVVPERDFFQPYVDEAKKNPDFNGGGKPDVDDDSAATYLAAAFGDYLSGAKNLDLTIDMAVGDFSAYDLIVSLNLGTTEVRAMLGDLYVGYDGDKVNIKLNEINGYLSSADFSELLKNEQIANMLGGLGAFDVTQLFGGDMLGTVFNKCEMTTEDGIRRIHMPFALDASVLGIDGVESVDVDASIYIKEDGKILQSITGEITVLGKTVEVTAKPLKTEPIFPATDNAVDLSGVLDFVPDTLATASKPTLGISGTVVVNGQTVNADAYIDRTDGLKIDAVISCMGVELSVKYADGTVYVGLGNIDARGTADELPALVNALLDTLDLGKYADVFRMLIPQSLNDVTAMIKSLDVSDDRITLGLNVLTSPVKLYATRADGMINGFGLGIDFDMLGIKFSAAADFGITSPDAREIELPSGEKYITFAQLAQLITDLAPYLDSAANYDIVLRGEIAQGANVYAIDGAFAADKLVENKQVVGMTAAGAVCALGQTVNLIYVDGTAYVELAGIRVKLAAADTGKFKSPALRIIDTFVNIASVDPADMINGALGSIGSVTVNADGALVAAITVNGDVIDITFAPKLGTVSVIGAINGVSLNVRINVKTTTDVRDVKAPDNAEEYMNAAELDVTLDKLADILDSKAVTAKIEAATDVGTIAGELALSFADGIKARLTASELALEVTLYDGKIYFALGEIRVVASADDIEPLLTALDGAVPENILQALETMINGGINVQAAVTQALAAIGSPKLENGVITVITDVGTTAVEIAAATDLSQITIKAAGVTACISPEAKATDIPAPVGKYTPAAELISVIPDVVRLTKRGAVSLGFNASVATAQDSYDVSGSALIDFKDGIKASAAVRALGQTLNVSYIDGTAYASVGAIKAKFDTADIDALKPAVLDLIDALGIDVNSILPVDIHDLPATFATLIAAISAFDVKDGTITLGINAGGATLTVTVIPATGTVDVKGASASANITASATAAASEMSAVAPTNAAEYVDLAQFDETLKAAAQIARSGGFRSTVEVRMGDQTLYADLAVSLADGFGLRLTESTLPLDVTVKDGAAYIALGEVKITGAASDIPAMLTSLSALLPEQLKGTIAVFTGLFEGNVSSNSLRQIAELVVNSVAELSVNDGILSARINAGDTNVMFTAPLDAKSATATVTADQTTITARLNGITPAAMAVTKPVGYFAQAKDMIAAVAPLAPLALGEAFEIGINAEVYGVPAKGTAYFDFAGEGSFALRAEIDLLVGDLPVVITVDDGAVYIKIGANIRLSEQLDEQSLMSLVDKLDYAIDGLKETVQKIIDGIKSMTLRKLIAALGTAPAQDGFALTADLTANGLDVSAQISAFNANGVLTAIELDCNVFGIAAAMRFDAEMTDGVLTALVSSSANVESVPVSITLSPTAAAVRAIAKISDCAPLSATADYIAPVLDLVSSAKTAQSVTLDINAGMITADNEYASIKGTAAISFAPLAVDLSLRLFADTEAEEELNIEYTDGTLYIQSGNIKLSFNTVTDIDRLYAIVESYVEKGRLPEYLGKEIGKLLGKEQGASIFSDITLLFERFEEIAKSDGTPQTVTQLLFAPLKGLNNDSAIKSIIDMLRIFKRGTDVVISVDAMGVTLNVTPRISEIVETDGTTHSVLNGLSVDTILFGVTINANVCNYILRDGAIAVAPTADASEYVSIVEFIEMIDSAVNTLTARDENGNITFSLDTFTFDYELHNPETTVNEKGETVIVKDAAGRDKPLVGKDGNKVIDKIVKVSNKPDGTPVLKGKFEKQIVKDADGEIVTDELGEPVSEYKFSLEAHAKIEISTPDKSSTFEYTNMSPLLVDLYVINNDSYPDGMAFLDYMENNGNGERVSIDYTSVMEIVAAAMDIMGVNDDTVELLLGDYRQAIDKKVFESMDISGIDDLRTMLNGIADAANDGKAAFKDIETAWDLVMTAGSTEELRARLDAIKPLVQNAVQKLKSAAAAFGDKEPAPIDDGTDDPSATELNGKLYKDIANGVTIKKSGDTVWATVNNNIATGTSGESYVTVTQSNNTIDSIQVRGLDVNTAKLNEFTANFISGTDIEVALPADYNTDKSNAQYSDFANIKYLLFDVMNTANMLEFEMGDTGSATSDNKINITFKLGVIDAFNIDVKYGVKVKIIDQGDGANPRYKTAAVVELIYQNCKALGQVAIPDCTTRLYFYDNVIYIDGQEAYTEWSWGIKKTRIRNVKVMYTLDDISNMLEKGDEGLDNFMRKFVFYLMPMTKSFNVVAYLDLQDIIVDQAIKMQTDDKNRTFAKVFKGYSYAEGKHALTIGLQELVGVDAFRDLNLTIIGANDGDDNILDNYVSKLHIDTSFIGMVYLSMDAKLNNADVYTDTDGVNKLRSSGLTNTTDGYDINGVIGTLIPTTSWQRIWAA